MNILVNLSIFLIGFSYSLLLYNKIVFGIAVGLATLFLILVNKKNIFQDLKLIFKKITKTEFLLFFLFLISFLFSTLNSINIQKSLLVSTYLLLIMFFSFLLFLVLKIRKDYCKTLFNFLSWSLCMNAIIIFVFHFINYDFSYDFGYHPEIRTFKGYMNVITLLTIISLFLSKSRLNIISLFLLIPNILISNCNSAILGLICGFGMFLLFHFYKNKIKKRINKIIFLISSLLILIITSSFIIKNLPSEFDIDKVKSFEFVVPTYLIDAHRQFIWSFSIEKIKENLFFGYGQDTSNLIDEGQRMIGSPYTGDMNFIPSHPHNFLIELILETGIIGTTFFIILIFLINRKVWYLCNNLNCKSYFIFFNSYFWSSSLVNFSFWLGWWQASYFLLLALITARLFELRN